MRKVLEAYICEGAKTITLGGNTYNVLSKSYKYHVISAVYVRDVKSEDYGVIVYNKQPKSGVFIPLYDTPFIDSDLKVNMPKDMQVFL